MTNSYLHALGAPNICSLTFCEPSLRTHSTFQTARGTSSVMVWGR